MSNNNIISVGVCISISQKLFLPSFPTFLLFSFSSLAWNKIIIIACHIIKIIIMYMKAPNLITFRNFFFWLMLYAISSKLKESPSQFAHTYILSFIRLCVNTYLDWQIVHIQKRAKAKTYIRISCQYIIFIREEKSNEKTKKILW